jgi:hypothetical protein
MGLNNFKKTVLEKGLKLLEWIIFLFLPLGYLSNSEFFCY